MQTENWGDAAVPTLGMDKIMQLFEKAEDNSIYVAEHTVRQANANASAKGTTNIVPGIQVNWGWGGGNPAWPPAITGLSNKDIIIYYAKHNIGTVYRMNCATGESSGFGYCIKNHPWAFIQSYKRHRSRVIQTICKGASGNNNIIIMQTDYYPANPQGDAWSDHTQLTQYYDVPHVWLYRNMERVVVAEGEYNGGRQHYLAIATPGSGLLPRYTELEDWNTSRIYNIDKMAIAGAGTTASVSYAKGNKVTEKTVSAECGIWNYAGNYRVKHHADCVYYNVDAANQNPEGYNIPYKTAKRLNTRWVAEYSIQESLPYDPAAVEYTEHTGYKNVLNLPAKGGIIMIRLQSRRDSDDKFRYLSSQVRPAIECLETWMENKCYQYVDCEEIGYDKWHEALYTWQPASETTDDMFQEYCSESNPDKYRYMYVEVPPNDMDIERETFVFAGMTGFEGHSFRILQPSL